MQTTTRDGLAEVVARDGWAEYAVSVRGKGLGTISVAVDLDYEEEREAHEEPQYVVQSDEEERYADGQAEARWCVAELARVVRNAHIEEQADRDADEATDAVTALVESGRGGDVLKALRAAGLI